MKRMEELIHLNKKIHFEGKVIKTWWLIAEDDLFSLFTFPTLLSIKHCIFFLCRFFLSSLSPVGWWNMVSSLKWTLRWWAFLGRSSSCPPNLCTSTCSMTVSCCPERRSEWYSIVFSVLSENSAHRLRCLCVRENKCFWPSCLILSFEAQYGHELLLVKKQSCCCFFRLLIIICVSGYEL